MCCLSSELYSHFSAFSAFPFRPLQLPAPQSGTLSRILSGTRPSVETVSDVCLKRICSLDTSAFSALAVLDDNCAL